MAIQEQSSAGTGLASVQELYDLINGKTTSTSGSTKTESSGISQEGMNAMLQSALAGTNGLAAISSGQRAAGGYGSSVNQLLTNDLLTRTASQIAQNNTTKTTVTSPQTQTVGGVSVSGAAKTAGFLQALQMLGETGVGKKLGKVLGISDSADTSSGGEVYSNPANNATFSGQSDGNPNYYSSSPSNMVADTSQIISADIGDFNSASTSDVTDLGTQSVTDAGGVDWSTLDSIGITSVDEMPAMTEDPLAFLNELGFADGGLVSKKPPSLLSTSQFNRQIDPLAGLNGANGLGINPDQVTNTPVDNPVSQASQSNDSGSGDLGNLGNGTDSADLGEGLSRENVSDISKALGIAGALTGQQSLSQLGMLGGIASSANPLGTLGLTALNVATGGKAGAVASAINSPTISNITDIALAVANPGFGIANSALGLAGLNSIGQAVTNAMTSISTEVPTTVTDAFSPMTQAVQAQQTDVKANENPVSPEESLSAAMAAEAALGISTDDNSSGSDSTGTSSGPSGNAGASDTDGGQSGDSAAAADGGHIQGPGTGISDSIDAKLSDGEFVLSADVVQAIGLDKLQALQDRYHTPAAVQKLKQFGKVR